VACHWQYSVASQRQTFRTRRNTMPVARPLKVSESPSSQEHVSFSSPSEEREGLLSGLDAFSANESEKLKQSSRWHLLSFGLARIAAVATGLLCLIFGLLCWFSAPPSSIAPLHFNGETLRFNGTHDFKRTVLLVSIDGLRDALFYVRSSFCS
jgi:hypothetical protein